MRVLKRDGKFEAVKFDKIVARIKKQTYGLSDIIDCHIVGKRVIDGVYDGVSTVELDNLAAETAASMGTKHPDYLALAGRIAVSSLHKRIKKPFSQIAKELHSYVRKQTGERAGLISDEVYSFIEANADRLDEAVVFDRDLNLDFFSYKTLEKSYLLKIDGVVAETPQHLYLRVACGIWSNNIEEALKTYEMLSLGQISHATPTLFNSGTPRPQMSSCFLLTMPDDSLESIYKILTDIAMISKNAGGIGLAISNIRSKGSYIKGTNGTSNGWIPMLRVFNETARYVDQCLTSETLINTDNGYKKICDIVANVDKVKSTDGNFHTVIENKHFDWNDKIVIIETENDTVRLTAEHPVLVAQGESNTPKDILDFKIKNNHIELVWINAGDLTENDILIGMK